jgi:hypothetical protein
MGERPDQIEEQINRTRGDLNENLRELEQRAKGIVDWRYQFENRPGTMLAIAFGGGVLASALIPLGRKRSSDRYRDRAYQRDHSTERLHRRAEDERISAARNVGRRMAERATIYGQKSKKSSSTLGLLKGALISVAASRLSSMISDLVAGYREELQRTRLDHKDFSRT